MATRLKQRAPLHQLKVKVAVEAEEAASVVLETLFGQRPVSYSEPDSSSIELSLFLPASRRPSRSQLRDLNISLRALRTLGVPVGRLQVLLIPLPDRDWTEAWKRHFRPFEIGRQMLVRPSWSTRRVKPGQAVVVLDPGLSFGTGQHPTTAFCLRELARARRARTRQSFLDIGTGSGILAIAAAKLGYSPVSGIDSDPQSIRVALANAQRNRVDHKVRFRKQDLSKLPISRGRKHDVVCANLLADLLVRESRRILNCLNPGGLLVLAGILAREFSGVDGHFRLLGARPVRNRREGEWESSSYRILP